MEELKKHLSEAVEKLNQLKNKLNLDKNKIVIKELEEKSRSPDFWKNEETARITMKQLSNLKQDIANIASINKLIGDAQAALELNFTQELITRLREIDTTLDNLESQTYLSGLYDDRDVYLSVHSGQGGTEAMDWAAMLQRMYQRWADQQGFRQEIIDLQLGEEAGIKSVTLLISGRFAFGYLRGERGTHRLVRQSPFNADNLRQTSFASVEVMPVIEDDNKIQVKPEEIEFEAFRSSGKGGQNVNKVSTAVRLKHLPTGITVVCQTQRHQEQNRKTAMQLLRAKLWEIEEQKRLQKLQKIKGEHVQASWGNQIRSYVLHPYKLVKDLRTNYESKNPEAVLDGHLQKFIEAELRQLS